MAEQLLNRLITAVETISSNNNLPNTLRDQRETGPTVPLCIRSTQNIAVGLDILKAQSADKSDNWDEDQEQ